MDEWPKVWNHREEYGKAGRDIACFLYQISIALKLGVSYHDIMESMKEGALLDSFTLLYEAWRDRQKPRYEKTEGQKEED